MSWMSLLIMFLNSLLILVVQMILPGMLCGQRFARSSRWSLADSFFCGWVLNVFLAILFMPFVDTTGELALFTRIGLVVFCVAIIISQVLKADFGRLFGQLMESLRYSFQLPKLLIGVAVLILFSLFTFSHNLGYDDVAHLHYIDQVIDGEIFPVYIDLVKRWQAVRYPSFGILTGVLASNITGSGLFLYYLIGLATLLSFLIKVYEFSSHRYSQPLHGLGCTALVGGLLVIAGLDNYFNYGLYPLGTAKILFLTGLLYLLFFRIIRMQKMILLIGSACITTSVLHHLNCVLLYAFFIPLLTAFLFFTRKNWKEWLGACCLFFLFAALTLPGVMKPGGGIIKYVKEPVKISVDSGEVKKRKKPTIFEKIMLRSKQLLNWIKDGRYKNTYFKRVFSLEMLFIPTVVLLFYYFTLHKILMIALICSFFLIIGRDAARTVPKQLLVSAYRSGTSWFLFDLLRSTVDLRSKQAVYTDSYTGLYLKILGKPNVKIMKDFDQFVTFNPLVIENDPEKLAEKNRDETGEEILLNGRFFGIQAVSKVKGEEKDSLDRLAELARRFNLNSSLLHLAPLLSGAGTVARKQLLLPLVRIPANKTAAEQFEKIQLADLRDKNDVRIWRDQAVIVLKDLKKSQKIEVNVSYVGESLDVLAQLGGGQTNPLRRVDVPRWKKRMFLTVKQDVDNLLLVIKADRGHFNGLGQIRSVEVSHLSDSDKFRYKVKKRPD